MPRRIHLAIAALLVGSAGLALAASMPRDTSHAEVVRGRYLVAAGDCEACHTADGGAPFAGDRPIPTPFGTIYSSNITPDKDTGIGAWSDADFWQSMHEAAVPMISICTRRFHTPGTPSSRTTTSSRSRHTSTRCRRYGKPCAHPICPGR